jgi:ammonium transporter, Amt family
MTRGFLAVLAGAAMASPALAQPVVVADSGDTAWVLTTSLLALFAILPGLALFHGRGRAGPTGFAMFAATAATTILFAVIGYSLIFATGSSLLGGASNLFFANLADLLDGATVSETTFALFQLTLALFAVAILVASVAERARMGWLLPFAALWLLLVYVPVARWVWSGWLTDLGALDYAGGIVVHTTAGVAALVIGLLLRTRATHEVQHDSRLAISGASLIAIGWLATIGGSALGAGDDAAIAMLNALLALAASVLTGMIVERVRVGSVSVYATANNALAGIAAISAGATFVGVGGALLLGVVGALASALATALVIRLKIGSAASAFALHGLPALSGALAFPLMLFPALGGTGFVEGSSLATVLAAQGVVVVAVALWTAVATVIAALAVSVVVPMKAAAPSGD